MDKVTPLEDILNQALDEATVINKRLFVEACDALLVPAWRADAAGRCICVNQAWVIRTGMPPADALGMGWLRAVSPGERERVTAAWFEAVTQGVGRFQMLHGITTPAGRVAALTLAQARHDARGQPLAYVGVSLNLDALLGKAGDGIDHLVARLSTQRREHTNGGRL